MEKKKHKKKQDNCLASYGHAEQGYSPPAVSFVAAYNQFHQYYIHGQFSLCKQEKARMYNCFRWRALRDEKARVSHFNRHYDSQSYLHVPTNLK